MKKLINHVAGQIWVNLVGKRRTEGIILRLATWLSIDLQLLAYYNMGILKYETPEISGETFVIRSVLKRLLSRPEPLFFDVGANVGDYSRQLRAAFPTALIHAFEPNKHTFAILQNSLTHLKVQCHNLGLASKIGRQQLYTYADELTSQHASMYEGVFDEIHKSKPILPMEFEITTIDHFCCQNGIEFIDFLKIDTEGSELAVLQGATRMIGDGRIGVIQFEFNEMNVISRCFLKDFYAVLPGYAIYRVDTKRLLPLGAYQTINEIFKFQNLVAISMSLNAYMRS